MIARSLGRKLRSALEAQEKASWNNWRENWKDEVAETTKILIQAGQDANRQLSRKVTGFKERNVSLEERNIALLEELEQTRSQLKKVNAVLGKTVKNLEKEKGQLEQENRTMRECLNQGASFECIRFLVLHSRHSMLRHGCLGGA